MNIGIIIQARTGSSRLPQKMVLPFYNQLGILETLLMRITNSQNKIPIVLATTINTNDDIIEEIGLRNNIKVFRGSEENVLDRFISAATKYKIEKIIRICADNPFLDMGALNYQISSFKKSNVDYWCYSLSDGTPTIKTHYGFWTEGVTLRALKQVASSTKSKLFLEHVTNFLYENTADFPIHKEIIRNEIEIEKQIRLTIDTEKDFVVAKEIYYQALGNNLNFNVLDLINFIRQNNGWKESMKNEIISNLK